MSPSPRRSRSDTTGRFTSTDAPVDTGPIEPDPVPLPDPLPPTYPEPTAPVPDGPAPSLPDSSSTVTLPMDAIVPYWRNPRKITDDAVNQLMRSIRDYGYQQPIVVDGNNVIIIGHTRYAALRRLGVQQIQVKRATELDPARVKELRILDNRTAEYTSWQFDELVAELSDLDHGLMRTYFPEVGEIRDDAPFDPDAAPPAPPDTSAWDTGQTGAEFVCPSCFHTWDMEIDEDQLRAGLLRVPATEGASA